MNAVLSMKNISKSFPGVKALDNVSIDIRAGEVHALVGENGAGKSTLMKILAGLYHADSGEIILEGKPVKFHRTVDALEHGVAMVHQELMPVMEMTVMENIYLGREPVAKIGGLVNRKKMLEDTKKLLAEFHLEVNPRTKMKELSVAQMQLVEIAKAVSRYAKIIIMDEPTSAITQKESDHLFEQIRKLTKNGVAIIYISHKMEEIFDISDRITVLRDGTKISENRKEDVTVNSLIKDMVGREMNMMFPESLSEPGETYFTVKNFCVDHLLYDVGFSVKRGEILGIAGLMGAGRTELVESIFGMHKISRGTIEKDGKTILVGKPLDAIKNGIAMLPEDRKLTGLNLIASVKDNMSIVSLSDYTKFGLVDRRKEKNACAEMVRKLNVKTPGLSQIVESLSGGNQQKVVIAKWLLTNSDVIILDDPTRGIDVNAKYEIYTVIRELARQGKAIIMISSEMPEIIGMCDRAVVMCEGRITGTLNRDELTQERIMRFASGITQ